MYIPIALVVSVGCFLAYVSTRPGAFTLVRSKVIHASPSTLFALVNDFHRWTAWSPWEKIDPTMTRTYEGPDAGVGATYRWTGSGKAGAGSMVLTESVADARIAIDLEFIKPFAAKNKTVFTFEPVVDGTKVSWEMSGVNPFMAKLFQTFVNMDKLVGKDFENGLDAMATVATESVRRAA